MLDGDLVPQEPDQSREMPALRSSEGVAPFPSRNCLSIWGFLSEDPPLVYKIDNSSPLLLEFAGLEKRLASTPKTDRWRWGQVVVHSLGHEALHTRSLRPPSMSKPD